MNNNDTFSIKRFGLLLQKDIQENWKKYLMYIATIYGVLVIILTWNTNSNVTFENFVAYNNREWITITILLFFAFGAIFAATMMEPMNNKTKRISYLMNPSSSLEKFLSRWLIVTVGYILLFSVIVFFADASRIFIASIRFPGTETPFMDFSKIVGEGSGRFFTTYYQLSMIIALYFLLQSLFVLGSTFWPKNSFIKTFSACLVIIISYVFICDKLISLLLGGYLSAPFFDRTGPENDYKAELTTTIVFSLFALSIWTLSFFRFKESEIIKRL